MARNFDEEFPVPQEAGPSFILCGHEFHSRKHIHPSWFLQDKAGVESVVDFIHRVLVSEDREVFLKIVHDPDTVISIEQLGNIASYLQEEISGRPTQAAPTSGPGEETTS